MGNSNNSWGVIHNQSNNDMVYCFHKNIVSPFQPLFQMANQLNNYQNDNNRQMLQQQQGWTTFIQKQALLIPNSFNLPKGRITTAGMSLFKFNQQTYLSIITAQGKNVILSRPITQIRDLRFRILNNQKFDIYPFSNEEAEIIKNAGYAATKDSGSCPDCNQKSKNGQYDSNTGPICKMCLKKCSEAWFCMKLPQQHVFCDDCYISRTTQRLLLNQNSIVLNII